MPKFSHRCIEHCNEAVTKDYSQNVFKKICFVECCINHMLLIESNLVNKLQKIYINIRHVDLSLFEPLFRLCIPHMTMYDKLQINRERVGNDFPDAAPRSLYKTGDDKWLGLSATSQRTFESLAEAMGMPQ